MPEAYILLGFWRFLRITAYKKIMQKMGVEPV